MCQGKADELWRPLGQARPQKALLRIWDRGGWVSWSWDDWRRRAGEIAGALRVLGVKPGDRVACQLTNSPGSCAALLGIWMAGGCVVSVPSMARGMDASQYLTQVESLLGQAEATVFLVGAEWRSAVSDRCPSVLVRVPDRLTGPALKEPRFPGQSEHVFVQYSSGSTSEPSGCLLSAKAIANQLSMLEQALKLDPECDQFVSWVPLSHDMGLMGCLLLMAYWSGTPQVLSTPERFLMAPQTWFADCALFGATITCGPNFSLDLAARTARLLAPEAIPLRRLVIGGERIEASTLDRACAALGPSRLRREALLPAYGLAEAVLAVTTTPVGEGPEVIALDRTSLAAGQLRQADDGPSTGESSTFVTSVGLPLPGNEIDIVGDGEVGEVRLRSSSLASGYLGLPDLTARRFTSKGLLTGDIGFVQDHRLYVTGRKDDLLIIAGRNIYARDIEAALIGTGTIRPGSCAVVQTQGGSGSRLIAVVEPIDHRHDLGRIAGEMAAAARSVTGARLHECIFLPRGLFPKTPSGKTQRFRCQELAGEPSFAAGARVRV